MGPVATNMLQVHSKIGEDVNEIGVWGRGLGQAWTASQYCLVIPQTSQELGLSQGRATTGVLETWQGGLPWGEHRG